MLMRPTRWREIDEKKRRNTLEPSMDSNTAAAPSLQEGSPSPDLGTIMEFVRFHAASSEGRIHNSGLITVDSSNTFMEWFFAGFTRITGTHIDEEDKKRVYQVSARQASRGAFLSNKYLPVN